MTKLILFEIMSFQEGRLGNS